MAIRLRLFVADEYKPLRLVPKWLWPLTVLALSAQIAFHRYFIPPPQPAIEEYGVPPSETVARLLSFGEAATLSRLIAMRLQAFDNQPGVSIPFEQLDYDALGRWLDIAVLLDERAEYPHFLMSKVYSSVTDETRKRKAAAWVWRQFLRRPDDRWEWMAHATNQTNYVIKDPVIALEMAHDLRRKTTAGKVPEWVRQIEVLFAENQNQYEVAAAILSNQLEAGEIGDPQEFEYTITRLESLVEKMVEQGEITNEAQWREKIENLNTLRRRFLDHRETTQ